jgi:biotin operon repressor
MKKKNNAKEILINYLLANPGVDISRESIIQNTGISKSRLSELINDIRSDGYEIITPNRSGIVRLEFAKIINTDIAPKEVRQWLIILALSKLGTATYIELICGILSIADSTYLYDGISTDDNYSDMDILEYLKEYNSGAKYDIDQNLPLPTFRKDLHALIEEGFVDKKRTQYKDGLHVIYSISEKSPAVLFESEDEMFDFMTFYDKFKNSLSNTAPLESLYKKCTHIYDWTSYDTSTQIYGKYNRIDKDQLIHLNKFVKYPYKTKTLELNYLARDGAMEITISSGLLFYSVETNCFYLLCMNMDNKSIIPLRLDRIATIQEGKNKNKNYRSSVFLNMYEEMFSAAFEPEKTHVKVLFQDFGNIRERLSDLHSKRKYSKLYDISPLSEEIPHSIVYEDDLRGVSAFSRFLRSFGSSALVVEPSSLQNLMIQSNQLILKNYEVTTNENK